MAEPFLGEIRLASFVFPPRGWALCNGQLLPINQNQALFSLLGTTYGGNGQVTFALPDLRGRVPVHMGGGMTLGLRSGEAAHTLTAGELPGHVHALQATPDVANVASPAGALLGAKPRGGANVFALPGSPATPLSAGAVAPAGGSQSHENMQPYLTLNFFIALTGIFPSRL
jgi:microcystin-dependent protein